MIEDRNVTPGAVFTATYKGATYTAEAKGHEDGTVRFVLADGTEHKSLSSAGKHVMGGIACNGWRFWSPVGSQPAQAKAHGPRATKAEKASVPAPTAPKASKPKRATGTRRVRQVKPTRSQANCPEGQKRWFCSACMDAFCSPIDEDVKACPAGHEAVVDDDLAPVGIKESEFSEAGV